MKKLLQKISEAKKEDLRCPNCGAELKIAIDANGEAWIVLPCPSCGWTG